MNDPKERLEHDVENDGEIGYGPGDEPESEREPISIGQAAVIVLLLALLGLIGFGIYQVFTGVPGSDGIPEEERAPHEGDALTSTSIVDECNVPADSGRVLQAWLFSQAGNIHDGRAPEPLPAGVYVITAPVWVGSYSHLNFNRPNARVEVCVAPGLPVFYNRFGLDTVIVEHGDFDLNYRTRLLIDGEFGAPTA